MHYIDTDYVSLSVPPSCAHGMPGFSFLALSPVYSMTLCVGVYMLNFAFSNNLSCDGCGPHEGWDHIILPQHSNTQDTAWRIYGRKKEREGGREGGQWVRHAAGYQEHLFPQLEQRREFQGSWRRACLAGVHWTKGRQGLSASFPAIGYVSATTLGILTLEAVLAGTAGRHRDTNLAITGQGARPRDDTPGWKEQTALTSRRRRNCYPHPTHFHPNTHHWDLGFPWSWFPESH